MSRSPLADVRAVISMLMNGNTPAEVAISLMSGRLEYRVSIYRLLRDKGIIAQDLRYLNSLDPSKSEPMIEMLARSGVNIRAVYVKFGVSLDEVDSAA